MVGRLFNSLQYTLQGAVQSMHNQLFSLKPTLIFQHIHCLPLINPPPLHPQIYLHRLRPINTLTYTYTAYISLNPTYTYTAYISLNPLHIYLHSLHLSSVNPPKYAYTDCISFVPPYISTLPASYLSLHLCLHSLYLIYPPPPPLQFST